MNFIIAISLVVLVGVVRQSEAQRWGGYGGYGGYGGGGGWGNGILKRFT